MSRDLVPPPSMDKDAVTRLGRSLWAGLSHAFPRGAVLAQGFAAIAFCVLTYAGGRESNLIGGTRIFVLPDDGMISMRYARNLSDGLGLVWNRGEYTQGYTNFGWTLLMALVHRLGASEALASLVLQLTSIALHGGTAIYLVRRLRPFLTADLLGFVALLMLINGSAATWALSGWEVSGLQMLWTLALLPAVLRTPTESEGGAAATSLLAASAAVLLRMDSVLLWGALVVYWVVAGTTKRVVVALALVSTLTPAGILLFQHLYYGSFVPNTAILKQSVGLDSWKIGLQYILTALAIPLHAVAALGSVLWCQQQIHHGGDRSARALLMAFVSFIWLAYLVHVGGDVFERARFLVPLFPTLIALGSLAIAERFGPRARLNPRLAYACAFALYTFVIWDFAAVYYSEVSQRKQLNREQLRIVKALELIAAPSELRIGVFAAGTVPYFFPELRFHDMLGKSDPHIARSAPRNATPGHNKWDYEYSLGVVEPDVLITTYPLPRHESPGAGQGSGRTTNYYADLWHHALFQAHYAAGRICLERLGEPLEVYEIYVRVDSPLAAAFPRCVD